MIIKLLIDASFYSSALSLSLAYIKSSLSPHIYPSLTVKGDISQIGRNQHRSLSPDPSTSFSFYSLAKLGSIFYCKMAFNCHNVFGCIFLEVVILQMIVKAKDNSLEIIPLKKVNKSRNLTPGTMLSMIMLFDI